MLSAFKHKSFKEVRALVFFCLQTGKLCEQSIFWTAKELYSAIWTGKLYAMTWFPSRATAYIHVLEETNQQASQSMMNTVFQTQPHKRAGRNKKFLSLLLKSSSRTPPFCWFSKVIKITLKVLRSHEDFTMWLVDSRRLDTDLPQQHWLLSFWILQWLMILQNTVSKMLLTAGKKK